MAAKDEQLAEAAINAALGDLPDWKYQEGLVTVYKTSTAADALALIAAIGQLAEEQHHHPDLEWRYNRVFLRYVSHDAGGQVTNRDIAAAAAVSEAAAGLGATAQPERYPASQSGLNQ
ncbi:4a-hydroxytetrahydrobiopterin dehydratase [Pseudarthrobacter sp. PvP004]|uniref:4a-hydroxytetrahydrobiopterin dehydratase n=1 Tax=Pseudarthrobacter sp. PvP004 TaxID=2817850 RepID=UPI001AE1AD8E|nr:4a-hydroxytetrahydrobiopterin dehydratase [Pseudarthrobacter sp. PvP004]MBP2265131.1 4a-hydroxytetrahydrobiopterin dehydratase [Pseudarthrobacter sp. PvP004]